MEMLVCRIQGRPGRLHNLQMMDRSYLAQHAFCIVLILTIQGMCLLRGSLRLYQVYQRYLQQMVIW